MNTLGKAINLDLTQITKFDQNSKYKWWWINSIFLLHTRQRINVCCCWFSNSVMLNLINLFSHLVQNYQKQAFLYFCGFDFRNFGLSAVYNSILFSSPLVLLSNLNLRGFLFPRFFMCPQIKSINWGMPVPKKNQFVIWPKIKYKWQGINSIFLVQGKKCMLLLIFEFSDAQFDHVSLVWNYQIP